MNNANLVAHELKQAGFDASVKNSTVIVALKARAIYQDEIEFELDKRFEGIEFKLSRIDSNKIQVRL